MDKDLNRVLKELRRTGLFTVVHASPTFVVRLSGIPFLYYLEAKVWQLDWSFTSSNPIHCGKWSITPGGIVRPREARLERRNYTTEEILEYLSENHVSVAERLIFNIDLLT